MAGQISRVLVDDNTRVHNGELLAELDVVALAERYEAETTVLDWRPGACGSLRRREAAARGFKTLLPQGAEGG